ncbi:MAG: DUF2461 domain-containing protein [Bacteroidales bacterium]|nr:DUF2461 domain-containing protein [Bacteroidales bacterium]
MEEILNFLTDIRLNNNREWFHAHKSEYENAAKKFEPLAERFLDDIKSFDPSVMHLGLKDCMYRFYRDIRFSKDKSPYKTHFCIYVCPGGKKSWQGGYYFHLEPKWEDGTGGSGLYCGSFMPDKEMLQLIREDIFNDGANYRKQIKKAKNFSFSDNASLKKNPKGFPESEFDDLVRLKSFILYQPVSEELLLSDNLSDFLKNEAKTTYPFVNMLNQAVSFSGNY